MRSVKPSVSQQMLKMIFIPTSTQCLMA
jgi:hypothetical protein